MRPLTAAQVSAVPRYGSASTRAPSSTSSRIASARSDLAAQTSASSSTSWGLSEGCQAGNPPWGRYKPRWAPPCGVPASLGIRLRSPSPRCDAQVGGFLTEELCDFAVAPEQRLDERGAAVAARKQVGAPPGVEHQLGKLAIVAVAGLVELRPAVVVPWFGSAPRSSSSETSPGHRPSRAGHCRSFHAERRDRGTGRRSSARRPRSFSSTARYASTKGVGGS